MNKEKRNYGFHIIGSTALENNSGCKTVEELKKRVSKTFGTGVRFEYWSKCGRFSGETYSN